jgi:hypothetical protein
MPAPLPVPSVPSGFPPLAATDGPTTPRTEAVCQTVSPCGQTALETEASSQTVSPGGQTTTMGGPTARTYAAPSLPASPTSAVPVRCPPLRLRTTWHSRLHPRHARPWHLRIWPHHLRPRSPTRSTTHVTLELRESHQYRLYISSRCQRRPYQWHLCSILIRLPHGRSEASGR